MLPSVMPIRLLPLETTIAWTSGPLVVAPFIATIVLPMLRRIGACRCRRHYRRELPLTVQLISVTVVGSLPVGT